MSRERLSYFLALSVILGALCGSQVAGGQGMRKNLKAMRKAAVVAPRIATSEMQPGAWETIQQSYGVLDLVAGVGRDQNVNSWLPSYEGAQAKQVELSNPHMAAADAAGNIYIADKESNSILKVTPAGTIHTVAGTHAPGFDGDGVATARRLNQPNGVFVLADGTFYIVDLFNGRIRRVGPDGMMTTIVHRPDRLLGGRAVWVSPQEDLVYFAGRDDAEVPSLMQWTPAGGVQAVANGFSSMGNITVDAQGRPIVTEDSGHRVFRVGAGGTLTVIAGNGLTSGGGDGFAAVDTGLFRVRGVACHPDGGLFLATQKGAHIWYVDPAGIIHKMIDCQTSGHVSAGNGQLWSTPGFKMAEPRAITIAPNGDLLITASDFGEVRVVKSLRPPSPPERLRLEAAAGGVRRLSWLGVPWQSYFVERSASLTPAVWEVIGLRTSTPGGETQHPLPLPDAEEEASRQGFYRLRAPR